MYIVFKFNLNVASLPIEGDRPVVTIYYVRELFHGVVLLDSAAQSGR